MQRQLSDFSAFKVSDEKLQMIFGGYAEVVNGSWHNSARTNPSNDWATWCFSGDGPGGEIGEESYSLDKITDLNGAPLFMRPIEPWDSSVPFGFDADAPPGAGS